jgi:hypothetical protein
MKILEGILTQGDYYPRSITSGYRDPLGFAFGMPKTIEWDRNNREIIKDIAHKYGFKLKWFLSNKKISDYDLLQYEPKCSGHVIVSKVSKSEILMFTPQSFEKSGELLEELGGRLFGAKIFYYDKIKQKVEDIEKLVEGQYRIIIKYGLFQGRPIDKNSKQYQILSGEEKKELLELDNKIDDLITDTMLELKKLNLSLISAGKLDREKTEEDIQELIKTTFNGRYGGNKVAKIFTSEIFPYENGYEPKNYWTSVKKTPVNRKKFILVAEYILEKSKEFLNISNEPTLDRTEQKIENNRTTKIDMERLGKTIDEIGLEKLKLSTIETAKIKEWAKEKYRHLEEPEVFSTIESAWKQGMKKSIESTNKQQVKIEANKILIDPFTLRLISYNVLAAHAYETFELSKEQSELLQDQLHTWEKIRWIFGLPSAAALYMDVIDRLLKNSAPLTLRILEYIRRKQPQVTGLDEIVCNVNERKDRVEKILKSLGKVNLANVRKGPVWHEGKLSQDITTCVFDPTSETEELYEKLKTVYDLDKSKRVELLISNLFEEFGNLLHVPTLIDILTMDGFSKEEVYEHFKRQESKENVAIVKYPVNQYGGEVKEEEFLIGISEKSRLRMLKELDNCKKGSVWRQVKNSNGGFVPAAKYFIPIYPNYGIIFGIGKRASIYFLSKKPDESGYQIATDKIPLEVKINTSKKLMEMKKSC